MVLKQQTTKKSGNGVREERVGGTHEDHDVG